MTDNPTKLTTADTLEPVTGLDAVLDWLTDNVIIPPCIAFLWVMVWAAEMVLAAWDGAVLAAAWVLRRVGGRQ